MKKITLALVFGLVLSSLATGVYAQENSKSMKTMMVESLSQYGRQLYNKGNYSEAANVFARIMDVDPVQDQAFKYLQSIKSRGVAVREDLLSQYTIEKQKLASIELSKKKQVVVPSGTTKVPTKIQQVKTDKVLPVTVAVPVVVETKLVAAPVIDANLDRDLADLQKDLNSLRQSLGEKSQQIKILEKQLPSTL